MQHLHSKGNLRPDVTSALDVSIDEATCTLRCDDAKVMHHFRRPQASRAQNLEFWVKRD